MVDQLYSKPYKDTFYLNVQFPDKHIKLEFNISEELFKNFPAMPETFLIF